MLFLQLLKLVQNEKKQKKEEVLPNAPFRMSKEEMRCADKRALTVSVPLGYGWKPSAFFCKKVYLKSHDWKQIAVDGILKFCLRGMLGKNQRQTLFELLDVLSHLCHDEQDPSLLDQLESSVNVVCAKLERDFPISVQTISVHILHHVVEGIKLQGPVHSWWMYCYERFNSWICQRVKNRRFPEATIMETYRLYDWVQFMKSSGFLPADMLPTVGENAEPFIGERVEYLPTHSEVEAMETYYNIKIPIDETGPLTHKFLSHNKSLRPGGKCWKWRSQLIEKDEQAVSSIVRVKTREQAEVARIQH